MSEAGSTQAAAAWPLPKFYFEVRWDNAVLSFQEISGLDAQAQTIEYRSRGHKTPVGIQKYGSITMKRGVLQSGVTALDWLNGARMNTIKRQPLTIRLLDESGNSAVRWNLTNAWPTKLTLADLKAEGGEVVVDTIEFAYESMTNGNA